MIKNIQKMIPNLTASLLLLIRNKPDIMNNIQLRLTARFPNIKDSGKV